MGCPRNRGNSTGYLAAPEEWEKFSERWSAALQWAGVRDFHAKRFFGRQKGKGEYKHLSDSDAAVLIGNLLDNVDAHPLI